MDAAGRTVSAQTVAAYYVVTVLNLHEVKRRNLHLFHHWTNQTSGTIVSRVQNTSKNTY